MYKPLNITTYLNNRGSTYKQEYIHGKFTVSGSSFPAEYIPYDKVFVYKNVPFQFLLTSNGDNIELEGQSLHFPAIDVKTIHFIGASNNGDFSEKINFCYDNQQKYASTLSFTDWIAPLPRFNENEPAIRFPGIHTEVGINKHMNSNLWYQRIDFNKKTRVNKIELEDNPSMHIFSITFEY
ncbi:hypothetical protein SAMN04488137_4664 [Fictibacillus solisalsi]|uniref:Uncharacterized protein n=1 Tax=Fictibacillus solisalsi TaxID=459525 RepID=A0A1H0BTN1_9BACL|nr:hypothetical protein [Fictibacillus solisalsi]SDN48933.1 hypothetical protein SAMN04488137_4664 [Fictibacillus solisalsi]